MQLSSIALALFACASMANASTLDGPARITCNEDYAGRKLLLPHPRKCLIAPRSEPAANWVDLRRIHWRGWGHTRAGFKAKALAIHPPRDFYSVHGYAFRLRPFPCGGDYRVYTRVKVVSRFNTRILRVPQIC